MSSELARVVYYSTKAKKPILLYPTEITWFSSLSDVIFKWKYNGSDMQKSFEIQVSKNESFTSYWSYSSTTIATEIQLSDADALSQNIKGSGVYYWRVRATGYQKVDISDWSNVGLLNIDMVAPTIKGIDIIVPVGSTGSNYSAEIHSNMFLRTIPEGKLGYFVGLDQFVVNKVIANNGSDKVRTFFGTISFDDLTTADISIGHPITEVDSSVSKYLLTTASNKKSISFAVVLGKGQKFEIKFPFYGRTTYDLRISEKNLYPANSITAMPASNADQLPETKLKELIFIGGAETPPFAYGDHKFVLLSQASQNIPYGKSLYVATEPVPASEVDCTVKARNGKNGFVTDYDLNGIKAGDALWFQRSYDAFRVNPLSQTTLLKNPFFGQHFTKEWFLITDVDRDNGIITLSGDFDNSILNVRYPNGTEYLPELSDDAYEVVTIEAAFDDGTTKSRKETIISVATGKFKSDVTDRGTSNPVGENGLSLRWLGMKHGNNHRFYPIIASSEQTLRVVGDVVTDFSGVSEEIPYYIAGDAFVVVSGVFASQLSDAFMFIGCEDSNSGVSEYCVLRTTQVLKDLNDQNGTNYTYVNRIFPDTNFIWETYDGGFIPLSLLKIPSGQLVEVFANVRDRAKNVACSSCDDMPSQTIRSLAFTEAKSDTGSAEGRIWIERNEKHATSTQVIVDTFPARDNYANQYMRLGNTPPAYRYVNWSGYLQEPQGVFYTWQRHVLGAIYEFYADTPDPGTNTKFFKVKINKTRSSISSLSSFKSEFVGGLIEFDSDPSKTKYRIVDVWEDIFVLEGSKPSYLATGAKFTLDNTLTAPDGTFSSGGLSAIYYKNLDNTGITNLSDLDKIVVQKFDRNIDFVNNAFSADLELGSNFGVRWDGWLYVNFDRDYEVILTGMAGRAYANSEDVNGIYAIIDLNNLGTSTDIGELSSGKIHLLKGWNKIIVVFFALNENAKISLSIRSDIDDSPYQTPIDGITHWDGLPTITAISGNTVTLNDSVITGNVSGNYALLNLLNPKTGGQLTRSEDGVNVYHDVSVLNNNTQLSINQASDTGSFNYDSALSYFVEIVGDYGIYQLVSSQYEEDGNPYSYLLLKGNQLDQISRYGKTSYLLSSGKLKVLSNTENTITFEPSINGTWTSVKKVGDNLVLTDETQIWTTGSFEGICVVPDIDDSTAYYIVSNSQNSITVTSPDATASDFVHKDYRLGDVSDITSVGSYLYVAQGTPKAVVKEDDLVPRAAKVYLDLYDFWGTRSTFMTAISLRGTSLTGPSSLEGSIVIYNLDTERIDEVISVGGLVYDANESNEIIGVYESVPLSAPAGFLFWRSMTWEQTCPDGTTVELYVRTAETESDLVNQSYNKDAFEIIHGPYTVLDFDIPATEPTAIDISSYTTDGTQDRFGTIKRRRWLQFKVMLKSTEKNITPQVGNISLSYTTNQARVFRSKNFELGSNIIRGFLTTNTEIPSGTEITWGISTTDSKDFNQYQIIPTDEAFEVLEPNTQFRLAAKLSSSSSEVPKIYDVAFIYETEDGLELPNQEL
jgi:hypothetical protein